MPEISPEEMGEMEKQAGQGAEAPVSQLIQQVGQGVSKLVDIVNKSQASSDEDRQNAGALMDALMGLVDGLEGKEEEPMKGDMGAVPMQAGQSGVPMGPQTKQ